MKDLRRVVLCENSRLMAGNTATLRNWLGRRVTRLSAAPLCAAPRLRVCRPDAPIFDLTKSRCPGIISSHLAPPGSCLISLDLISKTSPFFSIQELSVLTMISPTQKMPAQLNLSSQVG